MWCRDTGGGTTTALIIARAVPLTFDREMVYIDDFRRTVTQGFRDADHGDGAFIADWISMLDEVRGPVAERYGTEGREAEREMELAAVRLSIRNLLTFPWVKDKVDNGALKLRGAFFAISEGVLYHLDEAADMFVPVE